MNHIERYYTNQAGSGGVGPVFVGRPQRGYGIGSLFAGLFRYAIPILKPLLVKGAKAVGKAVLKRVSNRISDNARPVKRLKAKRRVIRKKQGKQTNKTSAGLKGPLNSII